MMELFWRNKKMADKIECTALKPGMYFLDGNDLLKCISADRNKTAMRKMVVIVKCRNMRTGAVKEMTFSGDTIETAYIEKKTVSYYGYTDGEFFYFYDPEGNEYPVSAERLEDEKLYLVDGLELSLQIFNENEILGVILPDKVESKGNDHDDSCCKEEDKRSSCLTIKYSHHMCGRVSSSCSLPV